MFPKLNYAKIEYLLFDGTNQVQAYYRSGAMRSYSFTDADLAGIVASAKQAGTHVRGLCDSCGIAIPTTSILHVDTPLALCDACVPSKPAGEPQPAHANVLVLALGLAPNQAESLKGATRLNFWRNGSLHIQVQHGERGVKFACPSAVITDAQLTELFDAWGWDRINPAKLYFKPSASPLVRL